jgi:hypothetical protein
MIAIGACGRPTVRADRSDLHNGCRTDPTGF